ncbi:hypothetical protein HHK36_014233 [Tetracentron sinense]|uniref:Uncharacterized protein n=1 Tax=Tetracentron sinense TaxID=13715 RepID=A0A834Z7P5_TETSI|nr:hypothetical protein HHK36_014233 [Tetracentron sinense]
MVYELESRSTIHGCEENFLNYIALERVYTYSNIKVTDFLRGVNWLVWLLGHASFILMRFPLQCLNKYPKGYDGAAVTTFVSGMLCLSHIFSSKHIKTILRFDIVAADADDLCAWKGWVESQLSQLTLKAGRSSHEDGEEHRAGSVEIWLKRKMEPEVVDARLDKPEKRASISLEVSPKISSSSGETSQQQVKCNVSGSLDEEVEAEDSVGIIEIDETGSIKSSLKRKSNAETDLKADNWQNGQSISLPRKKLLASSEDESCTNSAKIGNWDAVKACSGLGSEEMFLAGSFLCRVLRVYYVVLQKL